MQQWWLIAMCGSLLPLDQNFQNFLSLHLIPEYPNINTSNNDNRKDINQLNQDIKKLIICFTDA